MVNIVGKNKDSLQTEFSNLQGNWRLPMISSHLSRTALSASWALEESLYSAENLLIWSRKCRGCAEGWFILLGNINFKRRWMWPLDLSLTQSLSLTAALTVDTIQVGMTLAGVNNICESVGDGPSLTFNSFSLNSGEARARGSLYLKQWYNNILQH